MKNKLPISLIIHTYNSGNTLEKLLSSSEFIEDKIILDMGSNDDTLKLAKDYNCNINNIPKTNQVDSIRNQYIAIARHDWVLVLDSDEYLPDDAEIYLRELISLSNDDVDAYAIPRFNTICGQVMRGSGWYPDHQKRLFKKGKVKWSSGHHTPPEAEGGRKKTILLMPPDCLHIHHLNYVSVEEFITKQLQYALSDTYDNDSSNYDFKKYVSDGLEVFQTRSDEVADGQLSTVLSIIMMWDKIIRGLIHWEKLDRRNVIGASFTLPGIVYSDPELKKTKLMIEKLENEIHQKNIIIQELEKHIMNLEKQNKETKIEELIEKKSFFESILNKINKVTNFDKNM